MFMLRILPQGDAAGHSQSSRCGRRRCAGRDPGTFWAPGPLEFEAVDWAGMTTTPTYILSQFMLLSSWLVLPMHCCKDDQNYVA